VGAIVKRVRLVAALATLALAVAALLPLSLWLAGGGVAWLLITPAILLLLAFALLRLGLQGGSGGLRDVLAGQFTPQPACLERDSTVQIVSSPETDAVQATIHLDRPVAEVSTRYLSFAIDMSQIVGGKWWNPPADRSEWSSGSVPAPVFDLDRPQLDRLVRALAPAYLRLGGSESDKVYYDLRAGSQDHPSVPPGYQSVLPRAQWDAACAFARRNDLRLVFTLNAGPTARDHAGRWTGANAGELLAYTAKQNYEVSAWELGNEVNVFFAVLGPRSQISVEQYGHDLKVARALIARHTPGVRLAGQGSAFWPVVGEPLSFYFGFLPAYLRKAGKLLDLITWHYYPQQSRRAPMATRRAHPSRLLDPRTLDEAAHWAAQINAWRDEYAAGTPIWLGETGNAQSGGEPGISDAYLGGLWWLDQLGLVARYGHRVMVRQTLAGMNYGLLDDQDLHPRPDYWNSLLWKRLMGPQVLDVALSGPGADRLRLYAHTAANDCPGAVSLLALNLDPRRGRILTFPDLAGRPYESYEISTPDILGTTLLLNREPLHLLGDGSVPQLVGIDHAPAGSPVQRLGPLSYAFLRFLPQVALSSLPPSSA
jgi:heparanase